MAPSLPSPTPNQQTARAILAAWRRARPKAVADAISGSAAFELVEAIEGALSSLDGTHRKRQDESAYALDSAMKSLKSENDSLKRELTDLRRRLGLIEGDLKPGAKAEDARPNCATCGDAGFEVFNMEVIPCRKCVAGK